jgi:hypothetical protein
MRSESSGPLVLPAGTIRPEYTMVFSFARIGAVLATRFDDLSVQQRRL